MGVPIHQCQQQQQQQRCLDSGFMRLLLRSAPCCLLPTVSSLSMRQLSKHLFWAGSSQHEERRSWFMFLCFWHLEYRPALVRHSANEIDLTRQREPEAWWPSEAESGKRQLLSCSPQSFRYVSLLSSSRVCLRVSVQCFSACAFCSSNTVNAK